MEGRLIKLTYILSNPSRSSYIGIDSQNVATCVSTIAKALKFTERSKAENYKDNLKSTLKRFAWEVKPLDEESATTEKCENLEPEENYVETDLEKSGLDISRFFIDAVQTLSQLKDYVKNMHLLEQEYNKKILDIRHYIRDESVKLSAVQMQRIGYFLQQIERERYECKSNRLVAEIFLSDLNNLENINYVEEIKSIKESKYNPRIFTYEMLDEIVGKKAKK